MVKKEGGGYTAEQLGSENPDYNTKTEILGAEVGVRFAVAADHFLGPGAGQFERLLQVGLELREQGHGPPGFPLFSCLGRGDRDPLALPVDPMI